MEKKIISTSDGLNLQRTLNLPLSQAVKAGDFVFCSGTAAHDPQTGNVIEGNIETQTKQILENLKRILSLAESSLDKVVKVNVFLSDMKAFDRFNEAYRMYFSDSPPARTCVAVASLPLGLKIEIECVAIAGKEVKD